MLRGKFVNVIGKPHNLFRETLVNVIGKHCVQCVGIFHSLQEKLNDYPITMSKEKFDGYDTNNDGILYWKEYHNRVSQRYNYGDGPGPGKWSKEGPKFCWNLNVFF